MMFTHITKISLLIFLLVSGLHTISCMNYVPTSQSLIITGGLVSLMGFGLHILSQDSHQRNVIRKRDMEEVIDLLNFHLLYNPDKITPYATQEANWIYAYRTIQEPAIDAEQVGMTNINLTAKGCIGFGLALSIASGSYLLYDSIAKMNFGNL